MQPVLAFDQIHPGMLALVGGKAGNLGEMSRAGLPVPPGFCVTTDAYRLATSGGDLGDILNDIAATPTADTIALSAHAARARAAILSMKMPAAIAAAVADAYRELGDGQPVAVRSSATAEDLPFASFAGQQDTYLNIVGVEAVLDAVHRCWSSLWTDRAVSYRATNAIDPRSVRLAVVVQRMVDAAVAGVMFTANPVTGKRAETVIDASPGLGEAVVSGAVNPDHFVVNTSTGEIVERRLGDKRFVITATSGGGTTHVTRDAADGSYCITDDQVRALVALGERVARHYGSPQDTEWAIDHAGVPWLTQARPVTTLFPLPGARSTTDLRVYFCFSLAQGLHRPLTPMGLSAFRVVGTSAARIYGLTVADPLIGPSGVGEAAGRLFFDITAMMRNGLGRTIFPKVLDVMEARSAVVLRSLFEDPRLSVTQRSRGPYVRRIARIAIRFGVPILIARSLLRPVATRQRLAAIEDDLIRRTTPPDNATPAERLEFVIAQLEESIIPNMPRVMPAAAAGFAMLGLAGKLLGDEAEPDDLQAVLRALPHNVTTEMDSALWRLATALRANAAEAELVRSTPAVELSAMYIAGSLPPVVQQGLSEFLAKYGHRAVAEIDIGVPRWSEDPAHILGVLANYLRLDDPERAPDAMFAGSAAEAEAMVAALTSRARRRGRLRGRVVAFALNRARQLAGLRELPKYYAIVALAQLRRQLAAVGAALAATGRLSIADDVFFLNLREARAALAGQDMKDVVRTRREEYAHEMRRRHVPRVLLSDGTEPEAQIVPARKIDGALTGTPASAGSVTGRARLILDPVGAHLEPGEILVAPSTDPGWTPLFLTAGGLVMEMGGANSHGAVVAREYGIPAVVGVAGATSQIATGQQITVDGTNGVVTVAGTALGSYATTDGERTQAV
jgi:phosphoenolpyruvate synthase/pyruvate phosphate dikinase